MNVFFGSFPWISHAGTFSICMCGHCQCPFSHELISHFTFCMNTLLFLSFSLGGLNDSVLISNVHPYPTTSSDNLLVPCTLPSQSASTHTIISICLHKHNWEVAQRQQKKQTKKQSETPLGLKLNKHVIGNGLSFYHHNYHRRGGP